VNVRWDTKRIVMAAATILVLWLGFALAWRLRWYGDDIFITLRYAENFLRGHGLVYNVGERVDGFTHFLWLAVLIACGRAGADLLGASLTLGVLSFVGVLGLFALVSYRTAPRSALLVLPITSLALLANLDCRIWATSGLETAFLTLLLSLAFVAAFFSGIRRGVRVLLAGTFLTLAALTRPDALLFWGTGFLFLAARLVLGYAPRKRAFRDLVLFVLPLCLLAVPYQVWRTAYYGDVFPNTYYAKSGGMSYYSQGFYFLWLYFRGHPTSLLFLAAVPLLAKGVPKTKPRTRGAPDPGRIPALVALVSIVVYLVFFVARVGGGFMYPRFVVPVLPFAYYLIEWSVWRLAGPRRVTALAVLLALPFLVGTAETTWRNDLLLDPGPAPRHIRNLRGVLDEHAYYTAWYPIEHDRKAGTILRPYVADLDVRVLLRGQACLGYYGGFRTCIENNGLTDRHIAHEALETRHRVGHEKTASYAYLVERGVDFVFNRTPYRNEAYRTAEFDLPDGTQMRAEIVTYNAALMNVLSQRLGAGFIFIPFEQVLDGYIQSVLPGRTRKDLAADYRDFREYYFDRNDDPVRQRVFEDALAAK
jgi:hypothetical protein